MKLKFLLLFISLFIANITLLHSESTTVKIQDPEPSDEYKVFFVDGTCNPPMWQAFGDPCPATVLKNGQEISHNWPATHITKGDHTYPFSIIIQKKNNMFDYFLRFNPGDNIKKIAIFPNDFTEAGLTKVLIKR